MRKSISQLLLLGFFVAGLAAAEVYKWVDEDGVVHFTDKPPQDQQATEFELRDDYSEGQTPPGESVYSEAIEQQRLRRELREKERESAAIERQARKTEYAKGKSNCAEAIHYLNTLKKQCPVFYDGAGILRAQCPGYVIFYEGDRTYVEDDERERLIDHYSKMVSECRELDRY